MASGNSFREWNDAHCFQACRTEKAEKEAETEEEWDEGEGEGEAVRHETRVGEEFDGKEVMAKDGMYCYCLMEDGAVNDNPFLSDEAYEVRRDTIRTQGMTVGVEGGVGVQREEGEGE